MQSEILFILFLIAPWVLVLAAVLFFRHRQASKMPGGTDSGRDEDEGGLS